MAIDPSIPLQANPPQDNFGKLMQVAQVQQMNQAQQQRAKEMREHKRVTAMADRGAGLFVRYQSLKDQGFSEQAASAAMQEDWQRELGGMASLRDENGSPLFSQDELRQFGQEFNAGQLGSVLPQLLGAKQTMDNYFKTRETPEPERNLPTEEIGVGGGMFQKVQVSPDGSTKPLGQPYRKAADASVGLRQTEADRKAQVEADKRDSAKQAAIEKFDYTLNLIDDLVRHPGLSTAVGAKGVTGGLMFGQVVPGTDAADFVSRLDQLGGRAFLQAFETLKGGGQITQIEGEKATNAIARLQRSQSEAEFKKAALEFKAVLETGLSRLRAGQSAPPDAAPPPPADDGKWSIRPL